MNNSEDNSEDSSEDSGFGRTVAQKVVVSGRVQGVGYRFFCQRKAIKFGVRGWAKNCADGTVQVLAVGSADALQEFVAELNRGPKFGKVESVSVSEAPKSDIELSKAVGFYIR